jgi:rod shape determining protein RodA
VATQTPALGSLAERLRLRQVDLPLLLTTLLLIGVGLATLYSATYQWSPAVFRRQVMWLAVGAAGAIVLAAIPPARVAALLQAALRAECADAAGRAGVRGGAQGRTTLAGVAGRVPAAAVGVRETAADSDAGGVAGSKRRGDSHAEGVPALRTAHGGSCAAGVQAARLGHFAGVRGSVVRDGLSGGARARWLWLTVVAGALGFAGLWHFDILRDYQKARLVSFLNPEADPKQSGYHILQARIAVGSGQLTGKGYLHGTQKNLRYIPEQHTDFIFVVVAEELGFVGSVGLLGLYGAFLYAVWRIMVNTRNEYHRLLAGGILTLFTFHLLTNVGMTIGLFPVVGIPLPFISYGGSMLITALAAVGLLLAIRLHESPVRL